MLRLSLILTIAVVVCGCGVNQDNRPQNRSEDASAPHAGTQTGDNIASVADRLVLSENQLGELALPFPNQEMIGPLGKVFDRYSVLKEIGEQDGPDFPLYSIKKSGRELAYFEMDWEDTQKLNAVYIKAPIVTDQYGLAVGDAYKKIQQLRNGQIKMQTDYHMHTYIYLDGSNIMYEIASDKITEGADNPDTVRPSQEELKDWRIQQIIWRN